MVRRGEVEKWEQSSRDKDVKEMSEAHRVPGADKILNTNL